MAAITLVIILTFVNWESQALLGELLRRWNPPPVPDSAKAQQALVLTFLNQAEHLTSLQGELKKSYATRTTGLRKPAP